MIAKKLAGLLTTMAFLILTTTWIIRTLLDLPAMEPEAILLVGVVIGILYYFVLGRIVAWIGIRLVQERISENRAEEEARRHQARLRQKELDAEKAKQEQEAQAGTLQEVVGALGETRERTGNE
ncbi:MAG: hypothetical protein ACYTGH_02250 [Planctomycetota bacterium]|jgi:flagellar biosynthesis/type III secretory pathway M-ring protein FliF/YscJ